MKRIKQILLATLFITVFLGCECDKNTSNIHTEPNAHTETESKEKTDTYYEITVYSGGYIAHKDTFARNWQNTGLRNGPPFFYLKNGKAVSVNGVYVIKQLN